MTFADFSLWLEDGVKVDIDTNEGGDGDLPVYVDFTALPNRKPMYDLRLRLSMVQAVQLRDALVSALDGKPVL